jgi:hypothetical protein
MRSVALAAVGVIAAGVLAAQVLAAPTPEYPRAGTVVSTPHPTFRWRQGPADVAESVSVSTSPAIGLSGDFATLTIADILHGNPRSWTSTQPLAAGKYWWHVGARDTSQGIGGGRLHFSPATPFTVKAVITFGTLKLHEAGTAVFATLTFKADIRKVTVSMKLYARTKLIAAHQALTTNALIDNPMLDQATLNVPSTVKHGSPLKLVITLSAPGATTLTKMNTFPAA